MKHLIVLPGNSLKNKAWGELIADAYGPYFNSVHVQQYAHWVSGKASIDFVHEEEKIRTHAASLAPATEIVIFAKSAGSLLAFLAVHHKVVQPVKCVFFGIPFDLAADNLFKDSWGPVDSFSIPTIAFHNLADPTANYDYTLSVLATHAPDIFLITGHEDNHWYGDIATYNKKIIPFITGG